MRSRRSPKAEKSGASNANERTFKVVDPTRELLGQVATIESKVPWLRLAVLVLLVLGIPAVFRLAQEPLRPVEEHWAREVLADESSSASSGVARAWTRALWSSLDRESYETASASQILTDSGDLRRALRFPSWAAFLFGGAVFFMSARLVVGSAGALYGVAALSVSVPWMVASMSALPVLVGCVFLLGGVWRALALQSRHREVAIARVTALEVASVGLLFGLGLLFVPAALGVVTAGTFAWFGLALRRSSSSSTTLPVDQPAKTILIAAIGAVALAGVAALVVGAGQRLFAPGASSFLSFEPSQLLASWPDIVRGFISPNVATDRLIVGVLALLLIVSVVERSGRPWKEAGLIPWLVAGAFVFLMRDSASLARLEVPVSVPPFLLLGFCWWMLRGLRPGRTRRQEYGFVMTWLVGAIALTPMLVRATGSVEANLTIAAMVLPPLLIIAARASRVLWEAQRHWLGRVAVFGSAYWPVAVVVVASFLAAVAGESASLEWRLLEPSIVLGFLALGVASEIITVRAEPDVVHEPRRGRRRHRRSSGRAHQGSRPAGGGGRSSKPGGGGSGGRRRGGRSRSRAKRSSH